MTFPHILGDPSARKSDSVVAHRLMEDPVDHFVKLERLPEDLKLPPQFQNRLEFDPQAQKLVFHGYMSKSEFDQISSMTSDWRFRRTLEDLFRLCTPESTPKPNGFSQVLATFGQLFARR
jgi:hypothetical protein